MEGKTIGIIIAVLVVLVGGWFLFLGTPASAPTNGTPGTNGTIPASGVTIAYTGEGFSPKSVTIPLGTTVTFVNQTSDRMWVASAMHPDHVVYDGTAVAEHCAAGYAGAVPFDQCTAGASYGFTFLKVGTWGYHNHAKATDFGSVTVTAP